MAGSLAIIVSEQLEKPVSAIGEQWQISFSRFVPYPSLPSTCPSLVPRPNNRRSRPNNRRSRPTPGTWITTCSQYASLQLLNYHSSSDAILSVSLHGRVLEEHYISRLHFSWPQLSCISGYPARGSRTVFVSYKDSVGEIQKFALRFSTTSEAEIFINALKNSLKDPTETEPLSSDCQSEISSQSVFMSTNRDPSRASPEESSIIAPVETYSPQPPLNLKYEFEQESCAKETTLNNNYEGISAALPPSFTSLLSNCCSEVKQAAAQPSLCEEIDLKSQIARYMEDASFLDMLSKVEKIIGEIGDDLML